MKTAEAEIMRVIYRYRRIILEGRAAIPHRIAARLIGPDGAYRLYRAARTGPSQNKHKKG